MKDKIVSKFWNTRPMDNPSVYYELYNTNLVELGRMYDQVQEVIQSKTDLKDFLELNGAITKDGEVVCDRRIKYHDKEWKKDVEDNIPFMYPVYNWFYKEILSYSAYVEEVKWGDLLKGDFDSLKNTKHIELLAKGFKKAKEKISGSKKIDGLIELSRKRYLAIKNN